MNNSDCSRLYYPTKKRCEYCGGTCNLISFHKIMSHYKCSTCLKEYSIEYLLEKTESDCSKGWHEDYRNMPKKGTLTTFLEKYIEENKNPNIIQPKDYNLISAFRFRMKKIDWEYIAITSYFLSWILFLFMILFLIKVCLE